jgi:tRNA pseudouridine38-40 synthase
MRRIRITVSYDGTEYHGWQVQPGVATIQRTLEDVLSEIEGGVVHVDGSGRTDAGVHALAQVAAFRLTNPIPLPNLKKAMNRLLPHDIRVTEAAETHDSFHPRYDAIAKTYEYRLLRTEICPPFDRRYVYHYPYPLDGERMIQVAHMLEGEHDFTAFAAADPIDGLGRSKVRHIFSSCLMRQGDQLIYRVRGSGFLKHMVRNIVGVLLEVGKGNLGPAAIEARLKPGCKIPSGPSAPARGLFLVSVEYPKENLDEQSYRQSAGSPATSDGPPA